MMVVWAVFVFIIIMVLTQANWKIKYYAIGEIEFFDIDNVGCLATLYAYNDNRVAELDIWKYDFSQLKQIPKYF